MALEKGTIVATALRLLDEVGLDGLTLRRLAGELGVQAPALYWHFRNKQELLDAMAAAMMSAHTSRPALTEPAKWREWIAGYARADRALLNSYRDGARLVAGTRPSSELFAVVERAIEGLEAAGFSAGDAARGLFTVSGYVAGFVLEEQADRTRTDEERGMPDMEEFQAAYPRLMAGLAEVGDPQGDLSFEGGLRLILDGMGLRLEAQDTLAAGADQVSQAEGETAR
ncbi:TetR/AcrR family transcriptional regulator C-terminal domain-containing protein [Nonomuraea angiospora]|uniref:TetR/AcrR family transcriptional regulator C-terminal domain-containing protein n=1 Tax=Nonomuraea angiospora TaxID=46172 RepID=UPI0029A7FFE1|nr:TetR/AcrR family transcriptional regulator C-terminal domain-containing protein [Nonomuraea angiospora]MDX3105894.1 TetR/AcrR family transcriptional regulator C-terminal domain-containing protein [Nonomuraea angiospora]